MRRYLFKKEKESLKAFEAENKQLKELLSLKESILSKQMNEKERLFIELQATEAELDKVKKPEKKEKKGVISSIFKMFN